MANISGSTKPDTLTGTQLDDDIRGTSGYWINPTNNPSFVETSPDTAPDTLSGLGGNDLLYGYGGDDTLNGGDGDDTLVGGDGADQMYGDAGNDVFKYFNGEDPASGELVNGGAGTDTILFHSDYNPPDRIFDMRGAKFVSIEKFEFSGFGFDVYLSGTQVRKNLPPSLQITGGSSYPREISIFMDGAPDIDISGWQFPSTTGANVIGQNIKERITGSAHDDVVEGNGGNDTISGGAGNDTLHGGAGADNLYGGSGNDTFLFYDGEDPPVGETIDGGAGQDTLRLHTSSTATDTTFDFRNAALSSIDSIFFEISYGQNITVIFSANQVGAGLSSTLHLESQTSLPTYGPYNININMEVSTSLDISGWTFQYLYNNNTNLHIQGDADAETITGSPLGDTIDGGAGDDTISGGDGDDVLQGGAGADILNGGAGNDTFLYLDGEDPDTGEIIQGGAGGDVIKLMNTPTATDNTFDFRNANFQIEKFSFSTPAILQLNANQIQGHYLTIESETHGSVEEVIIYMGTSNNANLASLDMVNWVAGEDKIKVFGDADSETIDTTGAEYTIFADFGNDTIIRRGAYGSDHLSGGGGDDTFVYTGIGSRATGGIIDGGTGNDTLRVENITDLSNASFISMEETFVPSGGLLTIKYSQAGNGLGKTFNGDGGIWILSDSPSTDISGWTIQAGMSARITGQASDDIIVGADSLGWVEVNGNEGNDTITLSNVPSGEVVGGAGIDKLVLTPSTSGAGNLSIDMRDTWIETVEEIDFTSAGVLQTYSGGIHGSTILIRGNDAPGSTETIEIRMERDSAKYQDLDLSNWTFVDWGAQGERIIITANHLNNTITGSTANDEVVAGDGNDILRGLDGDDVLNAGAGNDILEGGRGNDTLSGGDGDDVIRLFSDLDSGEADNIDGGNGHDIIKVASTPGAVNKILDARNAQLSSIEEIEFLEAGLTIQLRPAPALANLRPDMQITGMATGDNHLELHLDDVETINISGWNFTNWDNNGSTIRIVGGSAPETITGSTLSDIIEGGGGADLMIGGQGNDILRGQDGNDTFLYADGEDNGAGEVVDGGAGTDMLFIMNTLQALNRTFDMRGADFVSIEKIAFQSRSVLRLDANEVGAGISVNLQVVDYSTYAHDERIELFMSTQTTLDLSGWTFVNWGSHGETIVIVGDNDDETITGSSAQDDINAGGGADTIHGGEGNDTIIAHTGQDTVHGDNGDDVIKGGGAADTINGGAGNDTLHGGTSGDGISGGDGNDIIYGNSGDDTINGDNGDDIVDGGKHVDIIQGGAGNDILKGGGGGDTIQGGVGDDTIHGNSGHDILEGGGGADTIYGNTGNDDLFGNTGDDTLHGGWGYDDMWGGGGVDTFVFKKRDWADRIKDFEDDVDIIDLTDWGFASVADALSHATEINGHVKFDFSSLPGAGSRDYLWVENITIAALQDDIIV